MNKDRSVQILRRFPDHIERRMIEIATIGVVTMIIRVDMRADFNTTQSKFANSAGQFLRGKIDIL